MPIPLLAIAAGVTAVAGLAKSYIGARQANKAAKMAAANTRPNFDVEDEYYTNQALAQNLAQSGLGQQSLDYYTDQANRGLSAGTDALLQTGGGPNAVAGLYDRFQQGIGSIATANAQAQRQNIGNLMDQNSALAAQKTMQWSLNKYEPFQNTARTAAELQATGTQNIFSGISQVGSAAGSLANAQLYQNSIYDGGSNANTAISQVRPNATVETPTYGGTPTPVGMEAADTRRMIDEGLEGMENSPYRDIIRRQMEQYYGRIPAGQVA